MAKAPSFVFLRTQPYPFKTLVSVFNVVSDFLVEVCISVRCGFDSAIRRNVSNEITGRYRKEQVGRVQSLSPAVTLSTVLLAEEIIKKY